MCMCMYMYMYMYMYMFMSCMILCMYVCMYICTCIDGNMTTQTGSGTTLYSTPSESPLYYTIRTTLNDAICVREFILAGTDVNQANIDGWTPLFYAATCGLVHVVRTLIQGNADVDIRDDEKNTLLHYMRVYYTEGNVSGHYIDIERMLVDAGAQE